MHRNFHYAALDQEPSSDDMTQSNESYELHRDNLDAIRTSSSNETQASSISSKDLTGGIRTKDDGDGHGLSNHVACDGAERDIGNTDPNPQSNVAFLPDTRPMQEPIKVETVPDDEHQMTSTRNTPTFGVTSTHSSN